MSLYFPFESISISLRVIVDLLLVGDVISSTLLNFCLANFYVEIYSSLITSLKSFLISRAGFFCENESGDNYLIFIVV